MINYTLLAIILGGIAILFGAFMIFRERRLKRYGMKTEGRVIRLDYSNEEPIPIIEFQTRNGKVEAKSKFVQANKSPCKVGDVVTIIYSEKNPRHFVFKDSNTVRVWSVFIFAGIFSIIAATYLILFGI